MRDGYREETDRCAMGTIGCQKESVSHDTCAVWSDAQSSFFTPEGIVKSFAVKNDDGKYDPTYLSQEMVELVSRVRAFGTKKYSRNNWKKGFKITRSLAAALRHIFAYLKGEDNDPESGLSHLGHAICSIEHAVYDSIHHKENDDRRE